MRTEAEMRRTRPPARGHLEPQKLEEAGRTLPWSLRSEHSPAPPGSQWSCPAWISDFWSPDLGDDSFLLFQTFWLWSFFPLRPQETQTAFH